MIKSYLVIEKGLIEETVFLLEERLTIGRTHYNDVQVSDPFVSREHAAVYYSGRETVVEDLESRNGTYINGERIKKSVLANGDTLRVGNVSFRFYQEEVSHEDMKLTETQDFGQVVNTLSLTESQGSKRSRRLIEAIAKVPLFSNLDEDGLDKISQVAHLAVFDRGRTIIQEGDRVKSLYIILDGRVRVFTYDHQGKELLLARLDENQFFGEISFLTGAPQSASVQALDETLLCEIRFEAIRNMLHIWPEIKNALDQYYRERISALEAKKRSAGLVERRRHPRWNEQLPVNLSISPTTRASGEFRGKVFRSLSQDISISGIRIKGQDHALLTLPIGCQMRLEISLPPPWGAIRCLGILRNMVEGKGGQDYGFLGIEFDELPEAQRQRLEQYLYG